MLGPGLGLAHSRRTGPPAFAAALSALRDHDAAPGPLGTLAVSGAAGPVSLVAGPQAGLAGDGGGLFDVTEAGGTISVAFDRAGLGAGFAQGDDVTTEVAVAITDGTSTASARIRARVARANLAPTAAGALGDLSLTLGQPMTPVDVSGDFADPGDTLAFAAAGLPAGLALSGSGVLSGTPTAEVTGQTVTVTAADSAAQTATSAFQVTVAAAAAPDPDPAPLTLTPLPGALVAAFGPGAVPGPPLAAALPGGLELEF